MRSLGIVGILLILVQTGDHPAIEVGEDRLLSVDGPERPLAESHLSADPNNANHLLVGVIQFDSPDGNNRTCVAWASFDGGQHWIRRALPVQGGGDPWGVILPDGSAIMVVLGYVKGREDNAFLLRSPDGGRTWPETTLGLGSHHDHPMVIARGNKVYVASGGGVHNSSNQHRDSVSVAHSGDGGRTFGPPTEVIASNLGYQAEGPVVLSDGMFVVGFTITAANMGTNGFSDLDHGWFGPAMKGELSPSRFSSRNRASHVADGPRWRWMARIAFSGCASPTSSTGCSFNVRMTEASRGQNPCA